MENCNILEKHRNYTQITQTYCNKKAVLSQRWPHNVPHIWVSCEFSGLPDYAHGYFSQNFSWAFVLIHPVNVHTKYKVRSFTWSWDNKGYPKIWAFPGYAHAPSSQKFLTGFSSEASYDTINVPAKLEVCSFTCSRVGLWNSIFFHNRWSTGHNRL